MPHFLFGALLQEKPFETDKQPEQDTIAKIAIEHSKETEPEKKF